jgi:hypothetical protein
LSTLEKEGCELLLEAPPDVPPDEALGDDELDEEELGEAALGDEELGDEELEDEELGDDELGDDELDDAPPEALPEDDDLLSVALGLELDEAPPLVLCAWATPASANSAAVVATPTTLRNMVNFLLGDWENCSARYAMSMPGRRRGRHGNSFTLASCKCETCN